MLKCLNRFSNYNLPPQLLQVLQNYTYVFNPSFVGLDGLNYIAVRVYCKTKMEVLALLFIWNDTEFKTLDLSLLFNENWNLNKIADPKLFIMDNKVWGTFNTGYSEKGENKLFLFNIENYVVKDFYLCHYDNRFKIEKNWTFFYKNNNLFVLYGLSPLTILKVKKRDAHNLYFEIFFTDKNINYNFSQGTSLALINKDLYGFIAHRKFIFKGKRLYVGVPFTFLVKENGYDLSKKKSFLVHSMSSMLGARFKLNKNLISCTYFSGLHFSNTTNCIVGYGINDTNWQLKRINSSKLWD